MCCRSCQALLPSTGDKLILNIFYSNETIFQKVSSTQEMLVVAKLFVLKTMGGLVLPVTSLVMRSLHPLLHYEAVLGGHSSARLWQSCISKYLAGERDDNLIASVATQHPARVTVLAQTTLCRGDVCTVTC